MGRNVFVLTTGRSGSKTFTRACEHMINWTAGHESRWDHYGWARLDYPDRHIEADQRLPWFLGALHQRYPNARYVHLVRNPDEVAASFVRKWRLDPPEAYGRVSWRFRNVIRRWVGIHGAGIMNLYAYGLSGRVAPIPKFARLEVARHMVEVVEANIREFIKDKPHVVLELERARDQFPDFWRWVGAEGDLDAAIAEFAVRHNAKESKKWFLESES